MISLFFEIQMFARESYPMKFTLFSIYIPFFLCTSDGLEREEKSVWNIGVKNADGIGGRSQLIDLLSKKNRCRIFRPTKAD